MSKLGTTIAFLLGAAAGGATAWYLLKELYAQNAEQDIASAKEAFHTREKKLRDELDELKATMQADDNTTTSQPTMLAEAKVQEKEDVVGFARGKYNTQVIPPRAAPEEPQERDVEAPYVISPDEFGEIGYTQVSLTHFADGILADENGNIIDNVEEIVGDALDHFGEYEDDSVFCRSDPKCCDYEILKDLRKYADVRKSMYPRSI